MHGFILWLLPSLADVSCVSLFSAENNCWENNAKEVEWWFCSSMERTPIAHFCKVLQNRSIDENQKKADCDQNFSARRLFINFDEPDYLFFSKNQGTRKNQKCASLRFWVLLWCVFWHDLMIFVLSEATQTQARGGDIF